MNNNTETQQSALQLATIHDVSGKLPNNLIIYRQAKKLNYTEFCKWINAKLGNSKPIEQQKIMCTGNDGNGCFLDSCGHNCGCVGIQPRNPNL